jgi:hypothetical protein
MDVGVDELTDDTPERIVPPAEIDQAAGLIGIARLDLLLVGQRGFLVFERVVEQTLGSLRRHDPPAEMISVSNGAALERRSWDGIHGRGNRRTCRHVRRWMFRETERGRLGRGLAVLLQIAQFPQADPGAGAFRGWTPDDDMVQNLDLEQLTGAEQFPGHPNVGFTG